MNDEPTNAQPKCVNTASKHTNQQCLKRKIEIVIEKNQFYVFFMFNQVEQSKKNHFQPKNI